MKKMILMSVVAFVACLISAGCCTNHTGSTNLFTLACVIEADTRVIYELTLDGKLVGSGETAPKQKLVARIAATAGSHALGIDAPGCAPVVKKIWVTGGDPNGQLFLLQLKEQPK